MGTIAARKAMEIMGNVRKVLAMEILAACQAIDLRGNKGLGKGTDIAFNIIRENIDFMTEDRVMNIDINICEEVLKSEKILKEVEKEIGILL